MKILIAVRNDPFASPSGTEIFVKNLSIELKKQGHDVGLVYETCTTDTRQKENSYGIEQHSFRLTSLPYIRAFEYKKKCARICAEVIKSSPYDAMIAFGAGTFAYKIFDKITQIDSGLKKPLLIYYAIDSMVEEYRRSMPSLLKRGLLQRLKAKIWYTALIRSDHLSCDSSDVILASCKDTANLVSKDYEVYPNKVDVVYFGLPDNYSDGFKIEDPNIPTFLHVSTVPERKGTAYFLDALRVLQETYNMPAKGVIAGSKESFYVQMAKNYNVNVDFLGRIPNDELRQYYASCTALVSPSLSEGFCLPVVEASMFGKPSIVTNVGSLPELVMDGENGLVVALVDVSALAEGMYKIANSNSLRRNLSENAKKKQNAFKISFTAKTLVSIINDRNNKERS